ncbi:MAG: hypothetical protein GX309_13305 [Clostridiales bacterium]|nr:hypothetical protein [Clostridiales bacterium]
MRKLMFVLLILILSISSVYAAEQVVEFDNPEVEEVVRKLIYKPTEPIYQSDLKDIRSIGSENYKNIQRLEPEIREKFEIYPEKNIQLNIIRFIDLTEGEKEYYGEFKDFYKKYMYVFKALTDEEFESIYKDTQFESEEFKEQCKQWDKEKDGKVITAGTQAKIDYAAKVFAKETIDKIITPNMNDLEKVRAIYDYMSYNWEYDYDQLYGSANRSWSIRNNPLYTESGVCGAYSYGFEIYCNVAGIECIGIGGFSNNIAHGWNLVKLDGKWYHCDPTWDTSFSSINGLGEVFYYLERDMFLISDEEMKKQDPSRTWEVEDYPVCPETYEGQQKDIIVLDRDKIKVLNDKERRKVAANEKYNKYESKEMLEIAKKKIKTIDDMLEKGIEYRAIPQSK